MAESYSERHGRKPPITVEALVELVFRRLREFEQRDYFHEAFIDWADPAGDEHPARIRNPEEYVITHLARPGLWDWLGDFERVVDERDFPPWDLDTLFDVIELFHNLIVSAPSFDFDGSFEGFWSQPAGQRNFREAMNEILPLNEPPAELTEDGRIIETSSPQPAPSAQEVPSPYEYDVFVSHAHEDKDTIARPLAQNLIERGYRVFLDENELVAGDSLRDRLTHARGHSRVGVVILSPAFFAKHWTQYELRALIDRDSTDPTSLIIPIWHGVDADQVRSVSPPLADRLALSADAGLPTVVRGIERALQRLAGSEARVPAAGTDGDQTQPAAALPVTVQRRRLHIPWLGKHERLTVGDYILVAVIAGIIVAAVLALIHVLGTSSHPRLATRGPVPHSSTRSSTAASSASRTTSASGLPAPGSTAVIEYADNRHGAPVFADPRGDPVSGVPTRIPYGTPVVVSCVAPNETGAMNTIHGFYLIASGRWRGDYVVADTMSNGGQLGATNTPNVDPRVRRCAS